MQDARSNWKDKVEDICDELEEKADMEMSKKVSEVQEYNKGYHKACEDFLSRLKVMKMEVHGE